MTKKSNGFTVIELIFIILLISFASVIFFIQKQNLEIVSQDNTKKTAINAMYYGLEEVYYPANGYYPQTISADNLKSVDPTLFTDPDGVKLGTAGSAYSYSPTNCLNNKCKGYTLEAKLKNESDFIKTSLNS
jgi:type II secretory pathway pseudopilin PulG